ncbi:Rieske 2Fe-2S domain-containing protein [Parasphingorhabdus halotolerans]|uniref:Aromatic ring-hydroxylating dioxygenase subunit alpha n=1 Tax=Parasphingorhabdus halotolerans TaxID=2725558 RepID=A0A6H2DLB4_9SPHN|nr:Rieske 2Fe-2S domain-containing protein [Parasphingorhabdus halotolerans]QJB68773.1 aromatic ring-hydroxylating dioxygenase subunit alpha [Parasphingorhabdus halotolerans]
MATTAEYGLGEHMFPRGWFMVGTSEDATTVPKAVRFFGEDMVLYRGESGRVFLVEAYCPHMGTHLANNSTSYVITDKEHVEGDNIRCPYHGWRFGPDGQCNDIPYSPAPPPKKACLKNWQVEEKAGCIWMWHDEEGGEPEYDLPNFEMYDQPHWVNWEIDVLGELDCHPQEVVDNMVDKGHLGPVHGSMDMVLFENVFDDHCIRQILTAGHKTLAGSGGEPMTNDTWYTGPGILQSVMIGEFPSHMLIAHTPVDDGRITVWHALMVKVANQTPTEEDVAMARGYQQASLAAFSQDFEIWANKRPCLNPMMVKGDGPFDKLRIWYRQFFNPRARAGEFQKRANGKYVSRGTINDPWDQVA